ncbi:MAG TPA: Type 1 glutamine amidotransferase-like domain-containing protein [Gaiellaceae bacterium]|nr:Type 1 glutamine amidotransferase-like domain-containing protein [Gaiellaceae bacterium]
MKRLLLASSSQGLGALPQAAGRDPAGLRLAFVPTAAGPAPEAKFWVQEDRRRLEALGCEVSTLDLATAGPGDVEPALSAADGVFLTGGNAYLLLWHARRSGFAELVVPLVESGELLYAGTSAGAILAGPDVFPAASMDNRAAVPQLESTHGLGLVDFSVLPHDQEPESRAYHDAAVAAGAAFELVRLTDDRAVVVRGGDREIVEE